MGKVQLGIKAARAVGQTVSKVLGSKPVKNAVKKVAKKAAKKVAKKVAKKAVTPPKPVTPPKLKTVEATTPKLKLQGQGGNGKPQMGKPMGGQSRGYGAGAPNGGGYAGGAGSGASATSAASGAAPSVYGADAFKQGYGAGQKAFGKNAVKNIKAIPSTIGKAAKTPYGAVAGWEAGKYAANRVMGSSASPTPKASEASSSSSKPPLAASNTFSQQEMEAARKRVYSR